LSKQYQVNLPIAEAVHQIIYHAMRPVDAVSALMQRTIKEEHL
jgi:glycerol-3-phosphate dehydrogenase (NAD(P)+)